MSNVSLLILKFFSLISFAFTNQLGLLVLMTLFGCYLLVALSCTDPGYVRPLNYTTVINQRRNSKSLNKLVSLKPLLKPILTDDSVNCEVQRVSTATYCTLCVSSRPERAHHCRHCHTCVEEFDHRMFQYCLILAYLIIVSFVTFLFVVFHTNTDCQFVSNCVGRLNKKPFLLLCATTAMLCISSVLVVGRYTAKVLNQDEVNHVYTRIAFNVMYNIKLDVLTCVFYCHCVISQHIVFISYIFCLAMQHWSLEAQRRGFGLLPWEIFEFPHACVVLLSLLITGFTGFTCATLTLSQFHRFGL